MTAQTQATMVKRLREAGKRLTAERRLLFDIVSRNPHLDAAGIYKLALEINPKIGQATVYRTLNLLAELELVDVSTLGEAHGHYELRTADHAHLICVECGSVREIPPPDGLRTIRGLEGFEVRRTELELIGLCAACARKRRAKETARTGDG
jgi:Fur family ferric uptake transcriptional regulator